MANFVEPNNGEFLFVRLTMMRGDILCERTTVLMMPSKMFVLTINRLVLCYFTKETAVSEKYTNMHDT